MYCKTDRCSQLINRNFLWLQFGTSDWSSYDKMWPHLLSVRICYFINFNHSLTPVLLLFYLNELLKFGVLNIEIYFHYLLLYLLLALWMALKLNVFSLARDKVCVKVIAVEEYRKPTLLSFWPLYMNYCIKKTL